jgi:hypothetical protein
VTLDHLTVVPDSGVVIAAPRGLASLAATVVASRREVALAAERGATMSELAATLAGQDRDATVTAQEADGAEWTITIGAATTPRQ